MSATSQDNVEMDHDTDAKQDTDIAADMSEEPADQIMVEQPGAIASAADFPADHWLEATDDAPIPIPPSTPLADLLPLPSTPTILERVLALTTQVTDMQMADDHALARVNAMEQEFDTCIFSMRAELSSMKLDVGATVTLVNGLVCLVEKLRQERVIANPSFPLPMLSHGNESSATTFGMRYMNGVFSPSAAPTPLSAGIGQTSASLLVIPTCRVTLSHLNKCARHQHTSVPNACLLQLNHILLSYRLLLLRTPSPDHLADYIVGP